MPSAVAKQKFIPTLPVSKLLANWCLFRLIRKLQTILRDDKPPPPAKLLLSLQSTHTEKSSSSEPPLQYIPESRSVNYRNHATFHKFTGDTKLGKLDTDYDAHLRRPAASQFVSSVFGGEKSSCDCRCFGKVCRYVYPTAIFHPVQLSILTACDDVESDDINACSAQPYSGNLETIQRNTFSRLAVLGTNPDVVGWGHHRFPSGSLSVRQESDSDIQRMAFFLAEARWEVDMKSRTVYFVTY